MLNNNDINNPIIDINLKFQSDDKKSSTDIIREVSTLSPLETYKTFELGLKLLKSGKNVIQLWENNDWEEKIKEKDNCIENLNQDIEQLNTLIKQNEINVKKEKKELVQKSITDTEIKLNCYIDDYKKRIVELEDKISGINDEHYKSKDIALQSIIHKYEERESDIRDKHELLLREEREKYVSSMKEYSDTINNMNNMNNMNNNNSTIIGQEGENETFRELNLMFPKCEIEDTHTTQGRGDFIIKDNDLSIMIETKKYNANVPKKEIDKFYRDMISQCNSDVSCGILISLNTGIATKEDFRFEVNNGKFLFFLHNVSKYKRWNNISLAIKFFKLIIEQQDYIDFTNQDVINQFTKSAKDFKRNYSKQKTRLDKFYADTIKDLDEQQTLIGTLFQAINVKY
jgi:hypothetical protein